MQFRLPKNLMSVFLIVLAIGCTLFVAPRLSFAIETKIDSIKDNIEERAEEPNEESSDETVEHLELEIGTAIETAIETESESEVISEFSVENSELDLHQPKNTREADVAGVTETDVAAITNERTLTQKLMPTYGNWCGANHPKDMDAADDPIDLLDQACKTHDYCYATEGYLNCSCDNTFNQELITGLHEKKFKPAEAVYARSVHLYFNGSPCNGDHSTKVAPSRLVHNVVKKVGNDTVNVLKSLPIIGSKIGSSNNIESSANIESSSMSKSDIEIASETDLDSQE